MPPRTRTGGLRSNPLNAVIPDPAATSTPPPAQARDEAAPAAGAPVSTPIPTSNEQTPAVAQPAVLKSVKFNGYVSPDHADRARDALYVLPGEWTTGRFLERAIDLALEDLAREYNGGNPFSKRPPGQGLRRGPRIT